MAGQAPLKGYSLSVAQQDVPSSWMPEARPRLANTAARRIVSVSSQSGTISSGQSLQFALPSNLGAGFLVSGSAYLKMTVSVTQAVAQLWAFKQNGSGASVIQRASAILSGQNVESINMYNKLYNSLLTHATNQNYLSSDAQIHDNVFPGAFNTGDVTVCIPIALACCNSAQHLPLFLLSSALLQFDTESVLQAITQGTDGGGVTNAVSNYQISNASVCFEQLCPEPAYEQGIKAMLASRVYQMKLDTFHNSRYAQQASITQTIGLNSSSVRGILWGTQATQTQRNAGHLSDGGQTQCYVYADGALVHNANLSQVSQQFLEMNRVLNLMCDTSRTSVAPTASNENAVAADVTLATGVTRATYPARGYLGGLSLNRESLDNSSFSFVGQPVQNLVIQWSGTATTGEFFVFVPVQQILVISGDGSTNLIR
jgi:hypothetical protein